MRNEEAILGRRLELLQQLNAIGAELLGIGLSEEVEPDAKRAESIAATLRELRAQAEEHDQMSSAPTTLVRRDGEEALLQRAEELQNELLAKQRTLEGRMSLKTVTPELNTVVEILQTRVADMEQELPSSLEDQKSSLEEVQESRRQLEELVSRIPEDLADPKAEELRGQGVGYLSRLADLIRRLEEAVGEKAAALAAYLTFKKDVESQLQDVESRLSTVPEIDATEDRIMRRIDELRQQEDRLLQLHPQVIERLESPQLGKHEKDEAAALKTSIEQASAAILQLRERLTEQLRSVKQLDEQRRHAERALRDLSDLADEAQRTLTDAAAIPQTYELMAQNLQTKADDSERLALSDGVPEGTRQELASVLERSQELSRELGRRWQLWQEFVVKRDAANSLLEAVRAPLDNAMNKGLRSFVEAKSDVRALEVTTFFCFLTSCALIILNCLL